MKPLLVQHQASSSICSAASKQSAKHNARPSKMPTVLTEKPRQGDYTLAYTCLCNSDTALHWSITMSCSRTSDPTCHLVTTFSSMRLPVPMRHMKCSQFLCPRSSITVSSTIPSFVQQQQLLLLLLQHPVPLGYRTARHQLHYGAVRNPNFLCEKP